MRCIALILAGTVLFSTGTPVFARPPKNCTHGDLCRELDAAAKRHNKRVGGPDPSAVCFRVLMKNPQTALIMTVRYADGREYKHSYPTGSATYAAGSPDRLPIFCISDWRLKSATSAIICTATKGDGGSATFTEAHILRLLRERNIPASQPVCLLGVEECRHESARK